MDLLFVKIFLDKLSVKCPPVLAIIVNVLLPSHFC